MKFRGQIKVPDVDHPAVGAMAEVEGSHFELFLLKGESLGRWSLADVRADRLVSNAFSVQLGEEEVTFLADDPIDFAYRGVEHMANEWARYRSMTLPRRLLATGRSRKDARPSRIHELRQAMTENLAGTSVTAIPNASEVRQSTRSLPGVGSAVERDVPSPSVEVDQPAVVEEEMPSITAPPTARQNLVDDVQETDSPATVDEPSLDTEEQPLVETDLSPEATDSAKRDEESVFKDSVPWAKTTEDPVEAAEETVVAEEMVESVETVEQSEQAPETPAAETTPESPVEAEHEDADGAHAPWLTPGADTPSKHQAVPDAKEVPAAASDDIELPESAPVEPVVAEAITEPESDEDEAEEAAATSSSAGPEDEERYIVDLGAFEDGKEDRDDDSDRRPSDLDPEREPVLSAADGRGGIMGAVRSAFVRNKATHDHEFVEAPGGIGITRQICTECGHISIGVSDSE